MKEWLSSYMEFLNIKIYYDAWYIPVSNVNVPKEYTESNINNISSLMGGSKTKKRRKQQKNINWGIIPFKQNKEGCAIPWEEI
jgi:hypothetical protein